MEQENNQEELNQLKEDLFLAQSDLEALRVENIALKNFIQNAYESCDGIEGDVIDLEQALSNLKENIRVFSRVNNIRL